MCRPILLRVTILDVPVYHYQRYLSSSVNSLRPIRKQQPKTNQKYARIYACFGNREFDLP